jgi:hypothetical protein
VAAFFQALTYRFDKNRFQVHNDEESGVPLYETLKSLGLEDMADDVK